MSESIHEFLEEFTTLVCVATYGSNSKIHVNCRAGVLFNLIAFGRFVEMYRKEPDFDLIVKTQIKNFLKNEFGPLSNISKIYKKDMKEMNLIFLKLYEEIMKSNSTDYSKDIFELRNAELSFHQSSETIGTIQKHFYYASFEQLFSFFVLVKYAYFAKNLTKLDDEISENKNYQLFLDNKWLSKMSDGDIWWQNNFKNRINPALFKNMIKYISDPLIKKILIEEDKFDHILNFEMNENTNEIVLADKIFPSEFTELFIKKSESNQLVAVYNLLLSVSKEEYHKYISAVICLKILFFEKKLSDKEFIVRIIIEFLFLIDILRTEFDRIKDTERINSLRVIFEGVLDLSHLSSEVEKQKNDNAKLSIQTIAPKTFNLIEILIFINSFSNDVLLDKLNRSIIKVLEKPENKETTSILDEQKEYLLFVFNEECKRYTSSTSQKKQQENEDYSSEKEMNTASTIKTAIFITISILLVLTMIGFCGFLFLHKQS